MEGGLAGFDADPFDVVCDHLLVEDSASGVPVVVGTYRLLRESIAKRQGGKFPDERIHRIIDGRQVPAPHGSREMPIWGWEFAAVNKDGTPDLATSDLLVAKLVDYLRSIQKP